MPELPEVEITARRLDAALRGAAVESVLSPGINVMRSFDPPLAVITGSTIARVHRRGKHLVVDFSIGSTLVIHLMSAGRLQLYDRRASLRDRTSRLLIRLQGARELRLREFGSKQAAWAKLIGTDELDAEESIASLGPEAWPNPPDLRESLSVSRPLHTLLRDQHVIAGIGRSWVDEILWCAELSPYRRGSDLDSVQLERLRACIVDSLDRAISHYERTVRLPIPDKLPMPLQIHRHEGEPCPRCGATLCAVHFEDYVVAYCPRCQTDGRILKDRRLSRLLK